MIGKAEFRAMARLARGVYSKLTSCSCERLGATADTELAKKVVEVLLDHAHCHNELVDDLAIGETGVDQWVTPNLTPKSPFHLERKFRGEVGRYANCNISSSRSLSGSISARNVEAIFPLFRRALYSTNQQPALPRSGRGDVATPSCGIHPTRCGLWG